MRILAIFCLAGAAAFAQAPGVTVAHAASHRLPLLPETGLAPGSLFEIIPFQFEVAALRFRAPDAAAIVELPFTRQENRFTALVPSGTPPGQAEVVVSDGAGKTYTTPVWIAASNFGLFTEAVQVWRNGPERPRLTAPILPGEWVTLWGTGLGNASGVTVNVAGIPVAPSYAGPAPGQPGLDQINFQFPARVPEDCYIPITASASNTAVVPAAAAPGPCRHRMGLSAEELATLDASGQIPVSGIWVHSDVIFQADARTRYSRYDSVGLDVFERGATGVQFATGIRDSDAPREGCTLDAGGGVGAFLLAGRAYDFGRPEVAGPNARRWPMDGGFAHVQAMLSDPEQTYDLAGVPPSAFTPGEWAVELPGGTDIPAFRIPLRIAPPLRWLNRAALPRLGRTDLTLTWDPAGEGATGMSATLRSTGHGRVHHDTGRAHRAGAAGPARPRHGQHAARAVERHARALLAAAQSRRRRARPRHFQLSRKRHGNLGVVAAFPAEQLRRLAGECGFELAGATPALPAADAARYHAWTARGFAGEMRYLTGRRAGVRDDPRNLLPSARSIVCAGKLYNGPQPYSTAFSAPELAWISRYAWGDDYHDLLRDGLMRLAARLAEVRGPFESKICVDTAPLLERSYARLAGLGWIGRNTCLIHEGAGSWFFLGELLVSFEVEPGAPPPDRCGTCTRCIDACPTAAIVPHAGRWAIDSRRCISYFTIELRGPVPEEHHAALGRHVFGCDICQDVCPWNRRAPVADEPAFAPAHFAPPLARLAAITEDEFRTLFRGSPVRRARYAGFLRNVALAMGNAARAEFRAPLERLAAHPDPLVAGAARDALRHTMELCGG